MIWLCRLAAPMGAEKPIPEEVDHREIAVPLAVMDKMELLLPPEPDEAVETRSCHMILVVQVIMSYERQGHRCNLNHEQVQTQEQIARPDRQGDRHQKEQRIVLPVIEIMRGNYVVPRVMDVMKSDVILEKPATEATMTEMSMK